MTVTAGLSPARLGAAGGALARRNPVLKLLAVTPITLVLVASLDAVTPAIVLGATLLALPWTGVATLVLQRARPLLLTAVTVGLVNAAFGRTGSGASVLDLGPVEITTGSAQVGVAIGLRVLAIGLPGIVALAGTDPVDLADSLVQQVHAPAKFAYGTLAALRLLPLLGEQWQILGRARRARGIDASRNPLARLPLFAGQVLALLVTAIRFATRLATAMDARGFDSGLPRTAARTQTVTATDWWLVAGCAAVALAAAAVSVALGTWRPLL